MNSKSPSPCVLLWFRRDLRLDDHPALHAAIKTGLPIRAIYVYEQHPDNPWPIGAASRAWLDQSLRPLMADIEKMGGQLELFRGDSRVLVPDLARRYHASAVFWNRRYEPFLIGVDQDIKARLKLHSIAAESFNGHLVCEPWEIKNQSGQPYRVYSAFWRASGATMGAFPCLSRPRAVNWFQDSSLTQAGAKGTNSESELHSWNLRSSLGWDEEFFRRWTPGEKGGSRVLRVFTDSVRDYQQGRDRPDQVGTSRLSPHFAFGELSVRRAWNEFVADKKHAGVETYLKEIFWREFAYHLLFHYPHTTDRPLNADFERFPWRRDAKLLKKWQQGMTGIPLVDAGMRELWKTGWMHNRVRMVVASFLVKNLMIPWQDGAKWFWDTLVDADLASNTMGWQWTAGCGADAAPYFRVFNPTLQAKRFDPKAQYILNWIPELKVGSKLSTNKLDIVFEPWRGAINRSYPSPVVPLSDSRNMVLQTWERFRSSRK